VNHIRDLAAQGYSIRRICEETGIARNTVRKYLRGSPEPLPRRGRASKLDPFHDQIRRWIEQDHLYNCQTMLERLRVMGYTGSTTILRVFVQPLRPKKRGRCPVIRYETPPGQQMQLDWGEFVYEDQGRRSKLFGLTTVLSHSRMRFVTFFKRCDAASLIHGTMEALEYYGGVPRVLLTDRMKSVLLSVEDSEPIWNARFADFCASIGLATRVCRAYTPQTKGKVERAVGVVKSGFWAGVHFCDLADLNQQARLWCDTLNGRVHRTTRCRPAERLAEEMLAPLPEGYAWERYRCEDRKVSWDGYVSYDGVLYGVPAAAALAGAHVSVSRTGARVYLWHGGRCITEHAWQPVSGRAQMHPEQFTGVPTAYEQKRTPAPLAHRTDAPPVARRPLGDYDNLFGLIAGEAERTLSNADLKLSKAEVAR
jgi:transposase